MYTGIKDRPTDRPYPESASAAAYDSETFPYAGYHTVFLDNQIALNAGEYFTVVIEVTNQSYQYPIAVEHKIESYSDWAVVHDYESWISLNGTDWKDGVDTIVTKDDRKLNTPMNACIKAFTVYNDNLSNRNTVSNDETFIIGKPLNEKPYIDIDVSDENKMRSLPVWKATLTIYASTDVDIKHEAGTEVTFYLENTTEDEEYLLSYADDSVTNHPLGLGDFQDEIGYDPLFEPGFEPDEFWQTYGNAEYPVYGPFTTTMEENQKIYIAVDALEYVSGNKGLIPAGYYNLVYSIANSGTNGSVKMILMEADRSEQGEDDPKPEPATTKTPSSSGGGCNVLTAAFATALLAFVPAVRKKKS
ncbi:MAG: hypothetical protein IJG34_02245 [Synergistaceae bacterium]|nr:hypothetical protein [Synergistaceae bacterium]MBR0251289.1 hypothetical protein [Synergistaceae bacterium]